MSERIKYLTDIEFGFDMQFVGIPRHKLDTMKEERTRLRQLLRDVLKVNQSHSTKGVPALLDRIRKELGDE